MKQWQEDVRDSGDLTWEVRDARIENITKLPDILVDTCTESPIGAKAASGSQSQIEGVDDDKSGADSD